MGVLLKTGRKGADWWYGWEMDEVKSEESEVKRCDAGRGKVDQRGV